jgi:Kef-type K+ transport system membrane component KefB
MFLVGVEFRQELLKSRLRSASSVSFAGMAAPFALGFLLALWLVKQPGFFGERTLARDAALFVGASMAITAFAMLASIIYERGLSNSSLGVLALAAGSIVDAAAWCVLAIVLASFARSR